MKQIEEEPVSKKVYNVSNFKNLTFSDIAENFDSPISIAALTLGVSESYLKRLCRTLEISRWPYRRIQFLRDKIAMLHETMIKRDQEDKSSYAFKILELQNEIDEIMKKGLPKIRSATKLNGVVKRGRPKKNGCTANMDHGMLAQECSPQWDGLTIVVNESDAPLGFHLDLDVQEIVALCSS